MSPFLVFTLAFVIVVTSAQRSEEDLMKILRPIVCTRPCKDVCGYGKSNNFCEMCGCLTENVCTNYPCPNGQTCVVKKRGWLASPYPVCEMGVFSRAAVDTTTTTTAPRTQRPRTTVDNRDRNPCPNGRLCMFDKECNRGQKCRKTDDTMFGRCCSRKFFYLNPKCRMDKDAGPCRAGLMKFFYNTTSWTCEPFLFGGCNPSENHFNSEQECKDECDNDCIHPRDPGVCRGMFSRYRFNDESGDCETFFYGGCGGNTNNWETKNMCETRCKEAPYRY